MEGAMAELFQRFAGGGVRECSLFDAGSTKVDAVAVCHEVRGVGLVPGERTCFSFRVLGRSEEGVFCSANELRELRSLQLDEVVLFSAWATLEDAPSAPHAECRACGEVRIPLRHLISRCDRMLYRTWIALESPGLSDSVASMGHVAPASAGEAFDQALGAAARQLQQPKACITICKAEDLGPGKQPLWAFEASSKERSARWGALLRSQRQHVLLATAQHLHSVQQQRDHQHAQLDQAERQIEELEGQARRQAQEQESLRERLYSCQEALRQEADASNRVRKRVSMKELEEKGARQLEESRVLAQSSAERAARRGRDAEAAVEAERQRGLAERLRGEAEELEEELAGIRQEAKDKMEAAEANMLQLRGKREEADRLAETRKAGNQQLLADLEQLARENASLAEQKEALMCIVEDLHQLCQGNGIASTDAIHSITQYRFP